MRLSQISPRARVTPSVFSCVSKGIEEDRELRLCSAKRSSLRRSGDEPFIEAAQTGPLCATQAAVSYFIQSTHSSENCYGERARLRSKGDRNANHIEDEAARAVAQFRG